MSKRHKMSLHGLWHLDKSYHRHHIGLFLRRSHLTVWVHRVIHLLKTTLKLLHPSPFFRCAVCRKRDGVAFWQRETSHHHVHQSRFKTSGRKIMFSQGRSPTWKHHFIEIVQNAFFECPEWRHKAEYEFSGPFDYLKLHLSKYVQIALSMPRI
jgi:stalled ribosome alternative rescue factor ArfA